MPERTSAPKVLPARMAHVLMIVPNTEDDFMIGQLDDLTICGLLFIEPGGEFAFAGHGVAEGLGATVVVLLFDVAEGGVGLSVVQVLQGLVADDDEVRRVVDVCIGIDASVAELLVEVGGGVGCQVEFLGVEGVHAAFVAEASSEIVAEGQTEVLCYVLWDEVGAVVPAEDVVEFFFIQDSGAEAVEGQLLQAFECVGWCVLAEHDVVYVAAQAGLDVSSECEDALLQGFLHAQQTDGAPREGCVLPEVGFAEEFVLHGGSAGTIPLSRERAGGRLSRW